MAKESRGTDVQAVQTMKTFRDRFIKLRNDAKQSQDEFAKTIGVTRSAVGYYEQGKRMPDVITLRRIATTCNVSTDWLLGLTADKNPKVSAIDELQLSEKAITRLKGYAKVDYMHDCYIEVLNFVLENRKFYTAIAKLTSALFDQAEVINTKARKLYSSKNELYEEMHKLNKDLYVKGFRCIPNEEYAEYHIAAARMDFDSLVDYVREQIKPLCFATSRFGITYKQAVAYELTKASHETKEDD